MLFSMCTWISVILWIRSSDLQSVWLPSSVFSSPSHSPPLIRAPFPSLSSVGWRTPPRSPVSVQHTFMVSVGSVCCGCCNASRSLCDRVCNFSPFKSAWTLGFSRGSDERAWSSLYSLQSARQLRDTESRFGLRHLTRYSEREGFSCETISTVVSQIPAVKQREENGVCGSVHLVGGLPHPPKSRDSSSMLLYYFASAVKSIQFHVDDDIIDKLNYYYTSSIITVFAILVSAKQYVGFPIQCWVPATFTDPMEQYTENYCWVQNTYFLPLHDYIPQNYAERENRQIGYYQWVPFVLALEALLFYVPCIIWRLLSWQSGIHIQSLVQMACDSRLLDMESRARALNTIATHVEEALHVKHQTSGGKFKLLNIIVCTRNSGSAVTCLYVSIKVLYLINIVGQVFLLNTFLGNRNSLFGFHVLNDLVHGREWEESGNFPRVTLCDFEVKVLGNVHRHTVQCVLMINMFNEKIFLFLWFWYILLAGANIASLVYWIFISAMPARRVNFVGKYLAGIEGYKMVDSQSLRRFVLNFLRHDGVFLLRMTSSHAGELVCYELAKSLWNNFCDNKETLHAV